MREALRLGVGLRVDVGHGVFKCKSLGCKELGELGSAWRLLYSRPSALAHRKGSETLGLLADGLHS